MKKLFLTALVLISGISFAQIDLGSTRYGVTGGLNYSRVRNAHNPSGPRYTFQAGALALIPIGSDDQFYLQPEITYYSAGETGKDKDAKGQKGYDAVYANNYISVPIYFKGYFSEAESEFFGMVGPRFNFLINQKVKNPSRDYYNIDGDPKYPNVNGKASPFAFAIGVGLGYSYKRTLELTLRGDIGVTNVYKNLMAEPGFDPAIQKAKKEHVISLGLSYIFE